MCFVFKTVEGGDISSYLAIRGNITVYIAFVATICHFHFLNNIRITKNFQVCPLPLTTSNNEYKHNVNLQQNISTPEHSQHTRYIYICHIILYKLFNLPTCN